MKKQTRPMWHTILALVVVATISLLSAWTVGNRVPEVATDAPANSDGHASPPQRPVMNTATPTRSGNVVDEHVGPPIQKLGRASAAAQAQVSRTAAEDAFKSAMTCRRYVQAKLRAEHLTESTRAFSAVQAQEFAAELGSLEKRLATGSIDCSSTDAADADSTLFAASLQAGIQGDLEAQMCFLLGATYPGASANLGEEQYRTFGPGFLKNGIDNHYWPIIDIAFGIVMNAQGMPSFQMDLPRPDPLEVYRELKLAYYRSDSRGTDTVASYIRRMEEHFQFSPQAMDSATRWAETEYQARYADSPPLDVNRVDWGCE